MQEENQTPTQPQTPEVPETQTPPTPQVSKPMPTPQSPDPETPSIPQSPPEQVKSKSNKLLLLGFALLLIAIVAATVYLFFKSQNNLTQKSTSYEECVNSAGSIIQESYPATCVTKDGERFVQLLTEEERKNLQPPTTGVPLQKPSEELTYEQDLTLDSQTLASITIILDAFDSPAEIIIADPQDRRTGKDPRTGTTYDEIPDTFYSVLTLDSDTGNSEAAHPVKEFYSLFPLDGSYIIQVIGTGSGSYTLDILNYDKLGDPSSAEISGQIEENSIDMYSMNYSSSPGAEVDIVNIE